jgi:hypothetical protein
VQPPTIKALGYAKATRPARLTALTVNLDDKDTWALQADWDRPDFGIPLIVIESRYGDVSGPVIDYLRRTRRQSPNDVATVVIPEYVGGHWWEQFLHNQTTLRLKARLLFQPNVMVTSVPYQLRSATARDDKATVARGDSGQK